MQQKVFNETYLEGYKYAQLMCGLNSTRWTLL